MSCKRCMAIKDKIYPGLKEEYKNAGDLCCKGCNNGPCEEDGTCLVYISCGPEHRCKHPCRACLYWTGYGIDKG